MTFNDMDAEDLSRALQNISRQMEIIREDLVQWVQTPNVLVAEDNLKKFVECCELRQNPDAPPLTESGRRMLKYDIAMANALLAVIDEVRYTNR